MSLRSGILGSILGLVGLGQGVQVLSPGSRQRDRDAKQYKLGHRIRVRKTKSAAQFKRDSAKAKGRKTNKQRHKGK